MIEPVLIFLLFDVYAGKCTALIVGDLLLLIYYEYNTGMFPSPTQQSLP